MCDGIQMCKYYKKYFFNKKSKNKQNKTKGEAR